MKIVHSPLKETIELDNDIYLLKIFSPDIANTINPGEFLNVRVTELLYPLLRRPFSVCDVEGDHIYLMFNIFGEGTRILSYKNPNDLIDILGPLGHGFNLEGDYETAVIVAGGLGAAPFPFLTRKLKGKKNILTFIGGRNEHDVITYGMENINIATDDGSKGLKGNVVDLLKANLTELQKNRIKIFACGPNAMLRVLKEFCLEHQFDCEASTECAMACGFGICQGCPIESNIHPDKYALVCKDGPVFNVKDVVI